MWRITVLFIVQFTLCLAIRVPVYWNDDSVVNSQENVEVKKENTSQKPIYNEYFQYTAKKPQFAIDIAAAHGAQSPEKPFKSHPIKPHTGLRKPELGQHRILNSEKKIYQPFQQIVQNTGLSYVTPVSTSYEVFHPFKAEQPALQYIYRDPVLAKIRNDVLNDHNRLQKYEIEAGQSDITKDEYLEKLEDIDRKKNKEKNVPSQYEIHKPQRLPVYYRVPSRSNHREQTLNHKLRHPWNQNIKVTPAHYRPVKKHLHNLRQQHALRYNDEHNEYPQIASLENNEEQPDGYDIYEQGKEKFIHIRNNFENSINNVNPLQLKYKTKQTASTDQNKETEITKKVENTNSKIEQEKKPTATSEQGQETPNNDSNNSNENLDDEEFAPIKNYAQVRKTETTKHLPRTAAIDDAENLEEINNAPRLREAIKSTKAQIVYSEEGYEDAAYDHAGEQKHASDHENHGGYLKETEVSKGKYKIPFISKSYKDKKGSNYKDQVLHGKKWKDDKKENLEETESNDYSESEDEHSLDADAITDENLNNNDDQNNETRDKKDEQMKKNEESGHSYIQEKKRKGKKYNSFENNFHDLNKRETPFEIPKFDFNSTLSSKEELAALSKAKLKLLKTNIENTKQKIKYPYYLYKFKTINKNSPLRYAENLALIPKKSKGGSEFYDSRSKIECPDVEDNIDPLPEKLKNEGHPDDSENNEQAKETEFKKFKDKQRLKGLGDKIDCFKVKYFDENPLDNPFFNEEIIENPEPITKPNLKVFDSKQLTDGFNNKQFEYNDDIFSILDILHNNRTKLENTSSINSVLSNNTTSNGSETINDKIILGKHNVDEQDKNTTYGELLLDTQSILPNKTSKYVKNKKDVTKFILTNRKKRAAPFMYEPYKIIRDSQIQDSKKTTTTGNISPLIKQLQSSRVIDKVTTNSDKEQSVKRNAKTYKDIGKNDRQKTANDQSGDSNTPTFVDVNLDQRRGEPRYELRPGNHKNTNSPVKSKRAMSNLDYSTQSGNNSSTENNSKILESTERSHIKSLDSPKTTLRPYFDVSKYLPQALETQSIAATTAVRKIIRSTTLEPRLQKTQKEMFKKNLKNNNSDGDGDNNDDDDNDSDNDGDNDNDGHSDGNNGGDNDSDNGDDNDDDDDNDADSDEDDQKNDTTTTRTTTTPTTSTTTKRSLTRKRIRGTTTIRPIETESELPKLRLTTRFRNSRPTGNTYTRQESNKEPHEIEYRNGRENNSPKYSEKKKKTTKSTLVTDTKTYGEDEDDRTKKEVDALIGVKHNIDEYTPRYEQGINKQNKNDKEKDENPDNDNNEEEEDEEEEEDDEEEEDEEEEDEDEEDDEDDGESENEKKHQKSNQNHYTELTTSEPTKRTLTRTTLPPATTTESRSTKLALKPVVSKKKIEIHEELPFNKASPHMSQFKQDIKEIEVIKEVTPKPKKKNNKNIEALDLFKDENLAEEINKLGDVEVFKENLNLKSGPRHGGNYRSITAEELEQEEIDSKPRGLRKDDTETSQSKTTKLIEVDKLTTKSGFAFGDSNLPTSGGAKNAKYVELRDAEVIPQSMHGGNLKFSRNKGSRQNNKSDKYIEIDENHEDEDSNQYDDNSRSYGTRNTGRPMHGGNYRSARIVQNDDTRDKATRSRGNARAAKTTAADVLSGFARTSPAPFILDPSKRMYYYVE